MKIHNVFHSSLLNIQQYESLIHQQIRQVQPAIKTYDGPEFEVEEILGKKRKGGVMHYLIKWKGYTIEEATWEPITNLNNTTDKVLAYNKS